MIFLKISNSHTCQDFDGFKNLFGKFINSTGPSVNWDKIEKLPQESVSKDFRFVLALLAIVDSINSRMVEC